MGSSRRSAKQLGTGVHGGRGLQLGIARLGDDDVPNCRASSQHRSQCVQSLWRGDEHLGFAVLKDIGDLVRFEQRIEWHEYKAC